MRVKPKSRECIKINKIKITNRFKLAQNFARSGVCCIMTLEIIYIFLFVFFNLNCYKKSLTVSMTGIGRPCLLWGGAADSALHQNSMKEGTETQCYYLDVRIKMGVTCKYLAPNLYRKFKKSFKRNSFLEKRLSLSQFLIFFVPLFGKQSHFDINNDF